MNALLALIKRAAVEAVENSAPCAVLFGTVQSTSPLEISIEQRFTLGEKQLLVPLRFDEFRVGDGIVLLRVQGGQQYLLLDWMEVAK